MPLSEGFVCKSVIIVKRRIKECFCMPEVEVKNLEITPKPKCLRCGSEHTVSDLGHWMPGWFTCQICNVRWEEDEYE